MKIYLAGPMRGLPEANYPEFHRVAAILRSYGHEVYNPAEYPHDGPLEEFPLREAFATYATWICREAEAIFLLPGWSHSRGARAERALAEVCGCRVIDGPTWMTRP